MKKNLLVTILSIFVIEFIAIIGVLGYLFFFSHPTENHAAPNTIQAFTENKLKNNPNYNIKAEIEIAKKTILIKEEISFKSYADQFTVYVPSSNIAETKIIQITSGTGVKSYKQKGLMLEIQCKGVQQSIQIEYEIHLTESPSTLNYSKDTYYLTNFLMTPIVFKGNKALLSYPSTFGDPYLYDCNNYYILFKTDRTLNIAAPGEKEEHFFGVNKITIFQAQNLRDFPAVLYEKAQVVASTFKNIKLTFINAAATKENVQTVLTYGIENIGAYPYKDLFIIQAPITLQGMEFSNMIFLSESCFKDPGELKRITFHEVFHQWFYGIIGTDQLNEPFLDEGLVNYLSMKLGGVETFTSTQSEAIERQLSSMHLNDYTSREEYYRLAYNEGANYFYHVHQKLGNNFNKLLQKIYTKKKFGRLYYNDFLEYEKQIINSKQ